MASVDTKSWPKNRSAIRSFGAREEAARLGVTRPRVLGVTVLTSVERRAARAVAIDPEDCGILYNVACIYSLQGKIEEAIDCLEKAMKPTKGHWYKGWAQKDPDLDSLRSHPRFQALLQES